MSKLANKDAYLQTQATITTETAGHKNLFIFDLLMFISFCILLFGSHLIGIGLMLLVAVIAFPFDYFSKRAPRKIFTIQGTCPCCGSAITHRTETAKGQNLSSPVTCPACSASLVARDELLVAVKRP